MVLEKSGSYVSHPFHCEDTSVDTEQRNLLNDHNLFTGPDGNGILRESVIYAPASRFGAFSTMALDRVGPENEDLQFSTIFIGTETGYVLKIGTYKGLVRNE